MANRLFETGLSVGDSLLPPIFNNLSPLSTEELPRYSLDSVSYVSLIGEIANSEAFQRLRDIRFLGAIDYLVNPNGQIGVKRHTRYEHSIGVAELAVQFSQRLELPTRDEQTLVVAALLHDIGHSPLSHSLESAFKGLFRLSHHQATEYVIKGVVSVGASLTNIFLRYGIDRDEILELISGNATAVYAEALRNPINIDTIDGIIRAYTYLSQAAPQLSPVRVVQALVDRGVNDLPVLDEFWRLKNTVYQQLIASPSGVIADYLCEEYFVRNEARFSTEIYFSTETVLRRKHPKLFRYLEALREYPQEIRNGSGCRIDYKRRLFHIDQSVPVDDFSSLYRRFSQEKHDEVLNIGPLFSIDVLNREELEAEPAEDLFADRESDEQVHSRFREVFGNKDRGDP